MKILTIAIPSYNSQDYLDRCVQSLLPGGEDVEILIVDDGSVDGTGQLADTIALNNSSEECVIRVIHQENKV